MNVDKVKELFQGFPKGRKIENVLITGGEPFANRHTFDIIE